MIERVEQIMDTQKKALLSLAIALTLSQAMPVHAQDPNGGGWRRIGEPRSGDQQPQPPQGQPQYQGQQPQGQPQYPPQYQAQQSEGQPQYQQPLPIPSTLTVPAGSWITIRVSQPLSSDHNQPGDFFSGTLAQPIVADGRIVARRGQTVGGRVVDAEKAGHVKGTSRLGLELTELSLVNGQQLPVRTQFVERRGNTSVGRDAGAIGAATGIGAAIGAAADGGFGAGMGAIAGAAASTIGVLATRGNATVVYPESLLTFRLEAPLAISTERSEQAFQPVTQDAYDQPNYAYRQAPAPIQAPPPAYYENYYSPYGYYPPYAYAPYVGTSLFFYSGPRYYGRGFGRGYAYGRHRW